MCDLTQYNPASFVQDIQNSAYQLPALAQQYLRRARALRLESLNEATEDQNLKARLKCGVQWFVASMAYAIRPWTDEQRFMVLMRVLMADRSLNAIMDTVDSEEGTFIPDDWILMFGLLTDELSFRDYGDLALEIFKPFVGWMESRPPATISVATPILSTSVEPIEPPPLFLPSPAVPAASNSSPTKLKRARPVSPSMTEAQVSKRQKIDDENVRPPSDDASKGDVPNLQVIPASPRSATKSDKIPQASEVLRPAIELTPAVWRVSSSSPLASHSPRFPSPENSVPFLSDPVPAPSRTPTPPCEKKERKLVSSRSKFTPTRNSSSSTVPVDKSASVTFGKLESPSKSKSVSFSKAVASSKSVTSSKPVASSESNSSSKSASSGKFVPPSKSVNSSKPSTTISPGKSASPSKPANPEKFVPSRRKSGSNLSNVPRTPQPKPSCLNLQRRLIIISPPPRPPKSTHRI